MKWIDLRSDTVTWPTEGMREAMAEADVGDDVYGEDPTVNRLQELAAELMGKEAGLFVASGTMGNLVAVLAHCGRGDELILGDQDHLFTLEGGGPSALGGVHPRTVANQSNGELPIPAVSQAVRGDDPHHPRTGLISVENTHAACFGAVLRPPYMDELTKMAHHMNLPVHLDGARIFNAAAALGVKPSELTEGADSVTFCLSKGLCAPVGSVLCGTRDFIRRAVRVRKMVGGGMRQVGVLAAAGLVALRSMPQRLVEDHERARRLARGLQEIEQLSVMNPVPETNMVYVELPEAWQPLLEGILERARSHGIQLSMRGRRRMRLVTHYWITDGAIRRVLDFFRDIPRDRPG